MLAEKLYPHADGLFCSYEPIIGSFGVVLVRGRSGKWHGDTFVFLQSPETGKYGFLFFSWGSCSGCDALQACQSYKDVDDLIDHLRSRIRWFDSVDAAKNWLREADHELECYSWEDGWTAFKEKMFAWTL